MGVILYSKMLVAAMATLWKKQTRNGLLEVRNAGNTIRLYCNGVLHTQYNPQSPLTGDVWDSMAMAPAFAPPKHIQRVLVLGVGGGAALRLIGHHFKPKLVAGVELDALRVQVAKKYFGLKGRRFKLYCDNAVHWMKRYEGEGFDLIIDDIFGEIDGEPQRFIPVTKSWATLLCKALKPQGILVVNTISASELQSTALAQEAKYQKRFEHAYQFQHPQSENGIGVFSPFSTTPLQFRNRIKALPGMEKAAARKKLTFSIKTLW